MKKDMMVLLAGGGTLGPVTPLLALAEAWRKQREDISFALVGTQDGPERSLAQASQIPFYAIPSVRLPRFFSMEWFLIPFRALRALAGA
ncbi:UDP-N-acetylglucosamine--N-acetylmuramyl-(pentapeptide) pyrophosphoryl-undecaprenol N-acetylglucosamine transferase, partial [Candidatus Parcubacteria bacterium]|nr:UDP-N-acetylglucosamine--N-acetylmuramyl-(pentapeptide) pyrophosphoryl-undecaprenol N-acetylglucosamine transferase [Candidatus Parcubacteria bacterium]